MSSFGTGSWLLPRIAHPEDTHVTITFARRRRARITALGAASLLCLTLIPVSTPMAAAASTDRGLFGSADPTYDGVFRQSVAILGLSARSGSVPTAALEWLLAQQCPNGAFQSYRADTSAPCQPGNAATYSGIDTNSTAAAAMALHKAGHEAAAARAVRWLIRQQHDSGGWAWIRGLDPDSFSTGLALAALWDVRGSRARPARASGLAWLRLARVDCAAPTSDRGALGFSAAAAGSPDPLSSGTAMTALTRPRGSTLTPGDLRCPGARGTTADTLAAWLLNQMRRSGGGLPDAYTPGATDWNATAWALIGLASGGVPRRDLLASIRALRTAADDYTRDGTVAAALGALLLVGEATDSRFPGTRRVLRDSMRT